MHILLLEKYFSDHKIEYADIKKRGSVPLRPEKTHKTVPKSAECYKYFMRTELLPLFDHLYFSHKTLSTNDFLYGLYIDPLGKAYQFSS